MNLISHYCKYFKVTKICNIKLKTKTWTIKYNDKIAAIQIVVIKKNFKKAAVRNLIKRRITNGLLENRNLGFEMERINANKVYDLYKIYINKPILDIDFNTIICELKKWLEL